jgi:D-serine deaminase-like pyridoxal phosphate-dependent protein
MSVFENITVPELLINESIVRANIKHMAEKARQQGVAFRPHFKTHQSAEIGEWFRQEGVRAITVSSLRMASYFAAHNWQDITVALPVNLREVECINQLAAEITLGILLEDAQTTRHLDEKLLYSVNAWIKVDAGYHRTGLAWDQPEALIQCAQAIQNSRHLHLQGLLTHGGNSYHTSKDTIPTLFAESIQRMQNVKLALLAAGFQDIKISVGDTPGCCLAPTFQGADEIRPGNFVYFDAQQYQIGACTFEQIAAVIACPIIALHPDRNEVVVYGGAVHLSKDTVGIEGISTYGMVCLPEGEHWSTPITGAYVKSLSQEHGIIILPAGKIAQLSVGDLLCIVPAHSCLSADLLGSALTLDGRRIKMLSLRDA